MFRAIRLRNLYINNLLQKGVEMEPKYKTFSYELLTFCLLYINYCVISSCEFYAVLMCFDQHVYVIFQVIKLLQKGVEMEPKHKTFSYEFLTFLSAVN